MPLRFLRGSYSRLALTVIALACGVALVCAIDLVNRAVLRAFVEVVDTMAGRAALQVTIEDGGLFPEDIAPAIARVVGVKLAVPVVTATAFTVDGPTESIAVQGFDLTNDEALRVYQSREEQAPLLEDPLVFLNQPDSVVLTHALAGRYHLSEGSKFTLDTSTGRRSFTVRALLDPQGIARAYGGNLMLMDLYAAEEAFTRPGFINRVDVVVGPEADTSTLADAIRRAVPTGLRVETPSQRKADLHAVMRSLQVLLQALGLVALVAAFMIAFNRLTTIFEERVWQLGVLRALGPRRRAVCWELVKESLMLGAVGVTLGVLLGIGLGRAILPVIAATTALNYRLVAPDAELSVTFASLVLAVLMGQGAALCAALLPAWRASGVSVAEILRGRGVEQPSTASSWIWIAPGFLALGIVGSLAVQFETHDPMWGLVATVLIVVAAKAAARPVLHFVGIPVTARLSHIVGGTGRFVTLSIARNPRRTALTIAMVGIGLATVFWLSIVAYSFEATTIRVFEQAMRADLVVSSSHIGAGSLEMPVDQNFAGTLRTTDGVASVVGVRLTNWDHHGESIVLDAFDPMYFMNPRYGQWPLIGEHARNAWSSVAQGEAVVVSSNFAQNLKVGVGDSIELATPNGALRLGVAGVTTDFASPRGTIEMSREVYSRYWNDPKVTRFFVETTAGSDVAAVRSAIAGKFGSPQHGWRIISSGELVAYWGTQVRRAFASVYVLAGVILGVILFGIVDNLSASVAERTREFGMVRALGVRRRRMWGLVLVEALMLSVLGLVLALAGGLVVGELWVQTIIPYLLGWVVELHVPIVLIFSVVGTTIVSCALAAVAPARRAAHLEPAEALRWE